MLLIPAGVAHCNLGKKKDVICIGGYPGARDYDMKYGKPKERPAADEPGIIVYLFFVAISKVWSS